jgi:hypothetical protein
MTLTAPTRPETGVPRAIRSHRPGWRNPRLLLGVVLVAGSVALGARLLATADDTVAVWAVARDLPAGAALDQGDLDRRQVRFPDAATADGYLAADDQIPAGATLDRPVSAGELLPRAAFGGKSGQDLVELPVSVVSDDLPATVQQGSVVDVWVTPKVSAVGDTEVKAVPVLTDVVVVAVPRTSDGLAPQSTRQVIVGVPAARADVIATALGGMADGRVVIARKG